MSHTREGNEVPGDSWQQMFDPATHRYYYYNAATGERTWTPPGTERPTSRPPAKESRGTRADRDNGTRQSTEDDAQLMREREKAAIIMQKHVRGSHERRHVRDDAEKQYKTHKQDCAEPIDPLTLNLGGYAEFHRSMPNLSDEIRYQARDLVARQLLTNFSINSKTFEEGVRNIFENIGRDCSAANLPAEVKAQLGRSRLYIDVGPPDFERMSSLMSDKYLLGAFDVIAIPIRPDFNIFFREMPRGGWFYVLHAAAPNIGEGSGSRAADFKAYSITTSTGPRLNADTYIGHMGRLWRNILLTASYLGIDDAILFPFGMGAFLRHLGDCDATYKDAEKRMQLRQCIAQELMRAIATVCISRNGPKRVHLCLVCLDAESIDNHNAFVEAAGAAAKQCPSIVDVLFIRKNTDVMQLAVDITKNSQDMKVAILNGANRKLFGNHWFANGARRAIDENMHRRSVSMATTSLLLNGGIAPQRRNANDLAENVWFFGGKVFSIDGSEIPQPDPSKPRARMSVPRVSVRDDNGSQFASKPVGSVKRETDGKSQQPVTQNDAAERIKSIFRNADRSGDGFISIDELSALLKLLGDFNDAQLREMFMAMDRNRDRQVSYDEFVDWILQIERGEVGGMGEEARFMLNHLKLVDWNVLGVHVRNNRQVAPEPDRNYAILDAVDLHDVMHGGPSSSKGASSELYRWLGIAGYTSFPDNVKRSIKHKSEAKAEMYNARSGYRNLIHVAIPDFKCLRPVAVRNLQTAFENVLNEFANSGLQCLRLAPFGDMREIRGLPGMTVEALRMAFEALSREQKTRVRSASIEFCFFSNEEQTAFKQAFMQA